MATDSTGKFHMNPQIAKMHDAKPIASPSKPSAPATPATPGGARSVEIQKQDTGGYHSIATSDSGEQEEADHSTYQEASDHAASQFGEEPDDDDQDVQAPDAGDISSANDGGY